MSVNNSGFVAWWPLDETSGKLAEDKVSGSNDPVSYVFNTARYKPASDPLWKRSPSLAAGRRAASRRLVVHAQASAFAVASNTAT